MVKQLRPAESLRINLQEKQVYHYRNPEIGIDVKCREVFKDGSKVVHFPFNPKNGQPRYRTITRITYEGLPERLPAGFLKEARTGFGFTRDLAPILYVISDVYPRVKNVIVSTKKPTALTTTTVIFNLDDLDRVRPKLHALNSQQKTEKEVLTNNLMASLLPDKFRAKTARYEKGQLDNLLTQHEVKAEMLSEDDIKSISELLTNLPVGHPFVRNRGILESKEAFDRIYIEDILERFEELLQQKTESTHLEDSWQEFFSDNILYFNFGYVAKFEKERIQGDKSLNVPDFILLNTYGFLDVFEIKTHLTQLLSFDEGRKNFFWTAEAARAISQAENYIDSIIKQEDVIIKNIRDEYDIHSVDAVRPAVYVIASSSEHIAGNKTKNYQGKTKKKLWNDFRRLNNSLKNVKFILYDELLGVFRNTLARLKTQDGDS